MEEITGFALLGNATPLQLERYKEYWDGVVYEIKPIKEIHLFLQQTAKNNPESKESLSEIIMEARRLEAKLVPETIRKWATNRQYIAKWKIDPANLNKVIEKWLNYKREKLEDVLKHGPVHTKEHHLPEYNGDYEG